MKTWVKRLLFEAYRRNDMGDSHEKSRDLKSRWLGLGTEAAYRPGIEAGYFVFHDRQTPPRGCMDWLVLTDEGIKAMNSLEDEFCTRLDAMKEAGYGKSLLANYQLIGGLTRR